MGPGEGLASGGKDWDCSREMEGNAVVELEAVARRDHEGGSEE